jgi:hypothetical protein
VPGVVTFVVCSQVLMLNGTDAIAIFIMMDAKGWQIK